MQIKAIDALRPKLAEAFPSAQIPDGWAITPEQCPEGMEGDITVNCFRFARIFKTSPDAVAEKIVELLKNDPDVKDAAKVKAFVNVTLNAEALFRDTAASVEHILAEAALPETARRRIVVEYSAPNTNKPQHLGHVRNNTLGMSVCKLLARVGHDVIRST